MVLPVSSFHIGDMVVFQKRVKDEMHIVVDVDAIGEVVEITPEAHLWSRDNPENNFPFYVRMISGRFDQRHNYFSNRLICGEQVRCILSNPVEVTLVPIDEQPIEPIDNLSDLLGGGF